jgi:hypothetical protein
VSGSKVEAPTSPVVTTGDGAFAPTCPTSTTSAVPPTGTSPTVQSGKPAGSSAQPTVAGFSRSGGAVRWSTVSVAADGPDGLAMVYVTETGWLVTPAAEEPRPVSTSCGWCQA